MSAAPGGRTNIRCAVDTPNHFFSYSFNPNPNWTRHFSRRDEILGYIEATADKYECPKACALRRRGLHSAEFDEKMRCGR